LQVSIIIPTLNEAAAIAQTLDAISRLHGVSEIVVVDGGSGDRTVEIATRHGARVLRSAKGRGIQLHTGACATSGEALWFLHADTCPPADAADRILEALEQPGVAGGNFTLCFDGGSRPARFLTHMYPHFRKLGLCYGDSGVFCRRSAYERAGGFQPFPIFEDVDLIQRLKRSGAFVHLPCQITTSSRRFEGRSFTWTFVRWMGMQVLYWMGVSPHTLGRLYSPIRGRKV
jgi:rSAM/selenodomain-associated transferase 2